MFYQDIVPAAEMYKYKWYRPICENDWYYYRPRTTPLTNQDNKEIYKTIDQELKKIFSFVVSKGYTTLPSCQGHFHSHEQETHTLVVWEECESKNNHPLKIIQIKHTYP